MIFLNFFGCLLLLSPLFVMLFLEKIIDIISYRRTVLTNNISKPMLRNLSIIITILLLFSHLVVSALESAFLLSDMHMVMHITVFGLLLLGELLLIIFYIIERNTANVTAQYRSLTKRSFIVNIILTAIYRITYECFLIWILNKILGGDENNKNFELSLTYVIGSILFVAVFTLIKVVIQVFICKKLSKKQIEG